MAWLQTELTACCFVLCTAASVVSMGALLSQCGKLIKRRAAGQDRVREGGSVSSAVWSCSRFLFLMSLDWGGDTAAGHDHRYHLSCITGGRWSWAVVGYHSDTSTAYIRSRNASGPSLYHCVRQSLKVFCTCICKPIDHLTWESESVHLVNTVHNMY